VRLGARSTWLAEARLALPQSLPADGSG